MDSISEKKRLLSLPSKAVVMPGDVPGLIEVLLKDKNYSEAKIAQKIGVNKHTIKRLRQAKMHDRLGRITSRLIALYCSEETYLPHFLIYAQSRVNLSPQSKDPIMISP